MTNKKAKLISCTDGDWQILYVDGKEVFQHHTINNIELLRYAEQYNFMYSDLGVYEATEEDNQYAIECGCFPKLITDLKGNYND